MSASVAASAGLPDGVPERHDPRHDDAKGPCRVGAPKTCPRLGGTAASGVSHLRCRSEIWPSESRVQTRTIGSTTRWSSRSTVFRSWTRISSTFTVATPRYSSARPASYCPAANRTKHLSVRPTWCVAECCGVAATVFRHGGLIGWQPRGDRWNHRLLSPTIYFDAEQYLFAVESAWDDRRWERPARATARLVVEQLRAHDPLRSQVSMIAP